MAMDVQGTNFSSGQPFNASSDEDPMSASMSEEAANAAEQDGLSLEELQAQFEITFMQNGILNNMTYVAPFIFGAAKDNLS